MRQCATFDSPLTFLSREATVINNVGIQEQSNNTLERHTFQTELIEVQKYAWIAQACHHITQLTMVFKNIILSNST